MKIEYIKPFQVAFVAVLKEFFPDSIIMDDPYLEKRKKVSQGIVAFVGLVGAAQGTVALDMTIETARKIGAHMSGLNYYDMSTDELDENGSAVVQEIVNMITGRAITELQELGLSFDITPPVIFNDSQNPKEITNGEIETVVFPIRTIAGNLSITLIIRDKL